MRLAPRLGLCLAITPWLLAACGDDGRADSGGATQGATTGGVTTEGATASTTEPTSTSTEGSVKGK